MKYIQNTALFWHSIFDKNRFILDNLKDLSKIIRLVFYAFLILCFYFSLMFLADYISNNIDNVSFRIIFDKFASSMIIIATAVISLIISYESIIEKDSDALIKAKKDKQKYIKDNKLQKWRLRNMNLFFRILFYIFCYFMLVQASIFFAMNGFMNEFASGATQEHVNEFINDFNVIIKYFTFIYIIVIIFFDYKIKK